MSQRYKIATAWNTTETQEVRDRENDTVHVVCLQTADLKDTRGGNVYRDGAQRVTVDGRAVRGGRFTGESAWMNAERLFGDLRWIIGRGAFDGSARGRK